MIYEILSGIWISNKNDINKEFLISKNINLIINCSKEIYTKNNLNIEEIKIPLESIIVNNNIEKLNMIFYDYIFDTLNFIHTHKLNKNILIYSTHNVQRPISIIISYLIYNTKLKPLEILLFVKSKCNQILVPKPIYLSSFEKIYEKSKIKKS